MTFYRCRCGRTSLYGYAPPPRCQSCPSCHTTLDATPELHTAPEPHRWNTVPFRTDDGVHPLTSCVRCGHFQGGEAP